jgi:hypothetical protein
MRFGMSERFRLLFLPASGILKREKLRTVSPFRNQDPIWRDVRKMEWADFYYRMVKPLVQAGVRVLVHVKVTANSEKGVSQNTVDRVICENVAQYGLSAEVRPAE